MSQRTRRFHLERLEERQLMAGDVAAVLGAGTTYYDGLNQNLLGSVVSVARPAYRPALAVGFEGGGTAGHSPDVTPGMPTTAQQLSEAELDADMGLPMLDSKPGASHTLYLDFNGHFEASWWNDKGTFSNITTPIFDTDYDLSKFGPDDQEMIRDLWTAVAEDYAPFDVNVTTHYYGDFNDGHALRVAIGGSSTDWYVDPAQSKRPTGTSNAGSFDDPTKSNVVFVFEQEFNNLFIERLKLATTISHEAGHGFGLLHQGVYDADGNKISEYNPGTAAWTPIMGDNVSTDRTTWNVGLAEDGLQDDMAFLSWKLGNRADDHGGTWNTGTALNMPLTVYGAMTGKGIIENTSDLDAFRFDTAGGPIDVTVDGLRWFGNLIPVIEVWSSQGLVASAFPTPTGPNVSGNPLSSAKLTAALAPGSYMLKVTSAGDYGDVGQYTVKVAPQKLATKSTDGPVASDGNGSPWGGKLPVDAYYSQLGSTEGAGQRDVLAPADALIVESSSSADRLILKRAAAVATSSEEVDANLLDEVFALVGAA